MKDFPLVRVSFPEIDVAVIPYRYLADLAIELDLISEKTPVIAHARAEDVREKNVFGVLPVYLAHLAKTLTTIPFNLPPGQVQECDLSLEKLREYADNPQVMVIKRKGDLERSLEKAYNEGYKKVWNTFAPWGLVWPLYKNKSGMGERENFPEVSGRYVVGFSKIDVAVIPHHPLADLAIELDLISEKTPVIAHARAEDVREKNVFGVLPVYLAHLAKTITAIPFNLPPGQVQECDLSLEKLREYADNPQVMVSRRAEDFVDQFVRAYRKGERGELPPWEWTTYLSHYYITKGNPQEPT